MKIRLTLTLLIERKRETRDVEPPHVFESQGSLVETSPQPRFLGFQPEDRA